VITSISYAALVDDYLFLLQERIDLPEYSGADPDQKKIDLAAKSEARWPILPQIPSAWSERRIGR
jgi:hypothetical protein